jgi:hypothetical protein
MDHLELEAIRSTKIDGVVTSRPEREFARSVQNLTA